MIYYIVYVSASKELLSDEDLSDILSTSRANNGALGITGILLYHEGNFIQVLEGPEQGVDVLYNKIAEDQRHTHVNKIISGHSDDRTFPDWAMGFKTISSEEWEKCAGYFKLSGSAVEPTLQSARPEIRSLLKAFIKVNLRFDKGTGMRGTEGTANG